MSVTSFLRDLPLDDYVYVKEWHWIRRSQDTTKNCAQCEALCGQRRLKAVIMAKQHNGVKQIFLCAACARPQNTDPRLREIAGWPAPSS